MNGISSLIEETPQSSPVPFNTKGSKAVSATQKRAFTQQCWHPDLGLPASRTLRNKFCCLSPLPLGSRGLRYGSPGRRGQTLTPSGPMAGTDFSQMCGLTVGPPSPTASYSVTDHGASCFCFWSRFLPHSLPGTHRGSPSSFTPLNSRHFQLVLLAYL